MSSGALDFCLALWARLEGRVSGSVRNHVVFGSADLEPGDSLDRHVPELGGEIAIATPRVPCLIRHEFVNGDQVEVAGVELLALARGALADASPCGHPAEIALATGQEGDSEELAATLTDEVRGFGLGDDVHGCYLALVSGWLID